MPQRKMISISSTLLYVQSVKKDQQSQLSVRKLLQLLLSVRKDLSAALLLPAREETAR